jgi:regulator of chromosome condensation
MAPKRALTESDAPAAKRARSQRAAPKTKTAPAPAQKNASKKAVAIPKKPVAPSKKTKSDDDSAPAAKRIKITKSSNSSPKTRPKAVPKTRVQKVLPTLQGAPTERLIILACGEGSAGELGLGTKKSTDVKRPRINAFLDSNTVGVVQMSAGGMHCIALTHDNKILTWGVNDNAALGRDTAWEGGLVNADGDSDSDSDDESDTGLNPQESTPAEVLTEHFPAGTVFVQVAAGDSTSFVLTNTGLVYGWGTFRVWLSSFCLLNSC